MRAKTETKLFADIWERGYQEFDDPLESVADGHSAVFSNAVQMACFMGAHQVYLVGCEHTYTGYFYDETTRRRGDFNRAAEATSTAHRAMWARGVPLVDCSIGGLLPIPTANLKDVLNS